MAIAIEASASDTDTTVPITTSGVNRALLLMIGGGNVAKPTAITFNGAAFTKAIEFNGGTDYAAIWLLLNPDVGTYNVTLDANGGYRALAVALSGVNTTLGVISTDTTDSSGASNTVSVASILAGDVSFGCVGQRTDVGNISVSTGTAIYTDNVRFGSGYNTSVGTSVDCSGVGLALRPYVAQVGGVPGVFLSDSFGFM